MAESALVEREDRIPRLYCLGDPRPETGRPEVLPVNSRISARLLARGTGDDVSSELRDLVFERLALSLLVRHTGTLVVAWASVREWPLSGWWANPCRRTFGR